MAETEPVTTSGLPGFAPCTKASTFFFNHARWQAHWVMLDMREHPWMLLVWLGPVLWIGVALFEELIRAFLLTGLWSFSRQKAWIAAVILIAAALVGLTHWSQGPYGIVTIADHQSLPSLKSLYPGGREIDYVVHPDGYAFAVVFQIPAGTPGPAPQYPAATEFAGGPTLVGYDLSTSSAHPGETVGLVLYWQATAAQAEDLVSFIHVGKGRHSDPLVANHDAQICGTAYPTSRWSEGEIILDRHTLTVVDDAPADTYEIAVGVYRVSDKMRLEIMQSAHFAQDNRVTIGTLTIAP